MFQLHICHLNQLSLTDYIKVSSNQVVRYSSVGSAELVRRLLLMMINQSEETRTMPLCGAQSAASRLDRIIKQRFYLQNTM